MTKMYTRRIDANNKAGYINLLHRYDIYITGLFFSIGSRLGLYPNRRYNKLDPLKNVIVASFTKFVHQRCQLVQVPYD